MAKDRDRAERIILTMQKSQKWLDEFNIWPTPNFGITYNKQILDNDSSSNGVRSVQGKRAPNRTKGRGTVGTNFPYSLHSHFIKIIF